MGSTWADEASIYELYLRGKGGPKGPNLASVGLGSKGNTSIGFWAARTPVASRC